MEQYEISVLWDEMDLKILIQASYNEWDLDF